MYREHNYFGRSKPATPTLTLRSPLFLCRSVSRINSVQFGTFGQDVFEAIVGTLCKVLFAPALRDSEDQIDTLCSPHLPSLHDVFVVRLPLLVILPEVQIVGHEHSLARQFYGRQTVKSTGWTRIGQGVLDGKQKRGSTSYFHLIFNTDIWVVLVLIKMRAKMGVGGMNHDK